MPKLNLSNQRFVELFFKILPGIFDGFGGLSYQNIKIVLDEWEIETPMFRQWVFEQSVMASSVIREIQEAESKNK